MTCGAVVSRDGLGRLVLAALVRVSSQARFSRADVVYDAVGSVAGYPGQRVSAGSGSTVPAIAPLWFLSGEVVRAVRWANRDKKLPPPLPLPLPPASAAGGRLPRKDRTSPGSFRAAAGMPVSSKTASTDSDCVAESSLLLVLESALSVWWEPTLGRLLARATALGAIR